MHLAQFFSLIGRAPVLRLLSHVPLHEPPPDGAVGAGRLDVVRLDQPERLRHEQRHPKGQQGGHEGFQGRLLCLEGDFELRRSGTLAEAGSERILAAFSLGAVAFLGCPKGHSALVQTLHVFQAHVYGLHVFSEVSPIEIFHDGSNRMLFLFQLPLLLSIRFQNTFVTYAYSSNIFQRMLNLFKFCFFTLLVGYGNMTFGSPTGGYTIPLRLLRCEPQEFNKKFRASDEIKKSVSEHKIESFGKVLQKFFDNEREDYKKDWDGQT
jgi:hypothetical protein